MKIKNLKLKGEKLLVGNEFVEFDADGIAFFDDEVGEGLITLPNFIKIEEPTQESEPEPTQEVKEVVEIDDGVEEADYKTLSNEKLKELLDEKGIEYPKNAKKDKLIELLG